MSLIKFAITCSNVLRRIRNVNLLMFSNPFAPQFQLIGPAIRVNTSEDSSENEMSAIDAVILRMGVPKSKVSISRKRMKHKQHHPHRVEWTQCERCGEPKRPHRICTKHVDICALSKEDYAVHLEKKGSAGADSAASQNE